MTILPCVAGGTNSVPPHVTLTVSVPQEIYLGQDVVLDLTLESTSEQSVYSLESADLRVVVEKMDGSNQQYVCDRWRIRRIKQTLEDGTELVETVKVKKQRVTIGEGDSSKLGLTFLWDFNARLSCGTYAVSAVYEGAVSASATFDVVVDAERSIPTLIDLVADTDEATRAWARNRLFSLVEQPAWKPSRADTQERVDAEVGALRTWWEANKGQIALDRMCE